MKKKMSIPRRLCLISAAWILAGCTFAPPSLSDTQTVITGITETVPYPETEENRERPDPLPVMEPDTEPVSPSVPTGAELSAAIAALPDTEALRQSHIADVITPENLDSLPPEMRLALWESVGKADTLAALRLSFREITGYSFHAWREIQFRQNDGDQPHLPGETDGSAQLVFTGDVCLADDWYNMVTYHNMGSDITNNITPELREILTGADVTMMNCECTLSDRGSPTPNKLYTFRGRPENAQIFTTLGCDIVSLANNHAHDYGREAFLDTMDALDAAGVSYVGAGKTRDEAMEYRYFIKDGLKIAFVSASNAEKFRLTPGATDDQPGILLMYDESDMLAAIDKAAREADAVIAYVHWGTENDTRVNENQRTLADAFIAHGCDAIIGAHPHVLQPWEIVENVPVVYSLGNFWFNMETIDTAVASILISLTETGVSASCEVYACTQQQGITRLGR